VIEGPRGSRIGPLVRTLATAGIFVGVLGGAFDPSTLKGLDTWENLIKLSGVPKEAFLDRFGITEADLSHPIKENAHAPGSTYDTEAVREWLKERLH